MIKAGITAAPPAPPVRRIQAEYYSEWVELKYSSDATWG
jgi:hypothetical protein